MDNHYTYRVEWSWENYSYSARCLEIEDTVAVAPTAEKALELSREIVDRWLRENEEFGAESPPLLSEAKKYSGRFMVRTSSSLHARLSGEAHEQRVSLNQWVVQKLADRKPNLDW